MNQQMLWHEDIYEALATDIQALGGRKRVGTIFWPEKSPEKAADHLSSCLNQTRNEKLDPEQVQLIITKARKVNSFSTMTFMSKVANFELPVPVEPEDEKAKLQRQFIEMGKAMQNIAAQIERNDSFISSDK